ncbi:hypothetical protein [Pseudarthrobacter albicanus]|uniref:hypothetical protein n=1 Tax=Pseudarthrobacter albicanus TaxID=2823873 RepID=UPI001BA98D71|nr:hypothetical protein [Pseudarthrobacter albicanus]
MLRIQVDIFSGRPNPEWIITDSGTVEELLDAVASHEGVAARPASGYLGLGFREIRVTSLEDVPLERRGVPRDFALASVAAEDFQASGELALRVVESMERHREVQLVAHTLTPLTTELLDLIRQRLREHLANPPTISWFTWPPYTPCAPPCGTSVARTASTR